MGEGGGGKKRFLDRGGGGGAKYADMTITINWHVNHFLCDIYLPSFIDYKHYYVIQV